MPTIIDGTAGITFPNSTVQASAGQVLQVVNATYSTQVGSATTSFIDTGLTATITPKLATSRILILANFSAILKANDIVGNGLRFNICKNGTQLAVLNDRHSWTNTALFLDNSFAINYTDAPATTSATTYKIQFCNYTAGGSVYVQYDGYPSSITILEIAQ